MIEDTIPMECSIESVTDSSLSIYNDCESVSIEVFWVAYDCGEVSYGIRGPTETFQIPSYDTHPWRIRNAETGELMREIPPLMGDTSLDVLMR